MHKLQWQPPRFFTRLSIMEEGKGDTVKYKRSLSFYDARKIVEEQLTAQGKSYASITKGAGVKCTNAQTQTDVTYDIQLKATASGGGQLLNLDKMQVVVRPCAPNKCRRRPTPCTKTIICRCKFGSTQ